MNRTIYIKRMRVMVMIVCLISIPTMTMLMFAPRTYRAYMGYPYELNYWWQTLVLTLAISCIICRLYRTSPRIDAIIHIMSASSALVVATVAVSQSWWGIVKICDAVAGPKDGVFAFLMTPLTVFLLWRAYSAVGKFVAGKK